MRVTCVGRIMVAIRIRKRTFLPRKRKRAKPYATNMEEITAPNVLLREIKSVLRKRRGKLIWSHALGKLSRVGLIWYTGSSVRQRPIQVMTPAVGLVGSINLIFGFSRISLSAVPRLRPTGRVKSTPGPDYQLFPLALIPTVSGRKALNTP